ncbi:MAG: hypothetical protein AB1384_09325 [Actinomycetota bacterium]
MRKALVPLLLGMVAVSLVVFISGCGLSAEDQAVQYINRGDSYAYRMASEAETLSLALEDFFAILQGPNPETIVNPGGPLDQYEAALDEVLSNSTSAQAEYHEVTRLEGVEGEATYAAMMTEVARKTSELMDFIDAWFDKALDVIKTLDEAKIRSYLTGDEFEGGLADIDEMRAEIDGLAGEAKDYRLEETDF